MPAFLVLVGERFLMPFLMFLGSLAVKWFGPSANSVKRQINVVELAQSIATGLATGLATHTVWLSILSAVQANSPHIFAAGMVGSILTALVSAGVDLGHRFQHGSEPVPAANPLVTPVADPTIPQPSEGAPASTT